MIFLRTVPVFVAMVLAVPCYAEEMPEMPKAQKEHAWLRQLAGKWNAETEVFMEPGKPPMKMTGQEHGRMIGDFFYMGEITGKIFEMPYTGICTLGYDADAKEYVGTWIDSVNGFMWHYQGKVDGNTLTLETKGPCPKKPGTLSNFKEVIEVKDKDHKVFTSSIQEEDGTWTKMLSTKYSRQKATE